MRAEILSIGTELMLGQIVDTNANYLAQQLPALGIDLLFVSAVGDNFGRLTETVRRAVERSDLVICTGGVGPTEDDLTREAIAEVCGEPMEVQPELEAEIHAFFHRRGRTVPESNIKQATTIRSGTYLPNPIGTAPGWWVARGSTIVVAMPGVPHEMRRMWEEQVIPRLAAHTGVGVIVSRTMKLVGIGESHAEEALGGLVRSLNPTLATYAKADGIHLRMTSKASTRAEAERTLAAFEPQVHERVGDWLYGYDDESFPAVVGALLRKQGVQLAVAESATGGAVASMVTDAPGASDYFLGGFVVYTRAAKEDLGVPADVLDRYGTVAEETSRALARAVRQRLGANAAIATTGEAGPVGSGEKAIGTLHIAVDLDGEVIMQTARYSTTRSEFKRRGSTDALFMLWQALRRREQQRAAASA